MTKTKKSCVWDQSTVYASGMNPTCTRGAVILTMSGYRFCPYCGLPISERKSK